jgi:hypothetical protein
MVHHFDLSFYRQLYQQFFFLMLVPIVSVVLFSLLQL